ncbi:hypothetical protein ABNF33_21520, partial [Paenibacillus larvae]
SKTLQTDKEVFNKLAQIYLEQVGLNGAAEEGLEQVNKKLEGLEGEKKKLEDIKKKKGSLNEKQQEELEGLDKNIQKHKEVRGKLEGIIKTQDKVNSKIDDATTKGEYMTQVLGEDVLKDIKFTGDGIKDAEQLNDALSRKIQKQIIFKYGSTLEGTMPTEFKPSNTVPGYGLPDQFANTNSNMFRNTHVIRRVYRHEGGTFPKLHAGGSPMFSFGNAPKAHEIDVRLLRNEMVLTEAQQANLFALIKNFDSIARKAAATIRGGDDEPRHDQTTIQVGQLVVREEMDIYRIAEELNRIKRLEDRSKGVR